MGTDYDQRKGAKRAWKKVATKHAEKALADEKTKRRDRKKRKGRRLCQGMCYKGPTITDEDLKWDGKADGAEDAGEVPSDIEDEVTAERKQSHASATPSSFGNPAVQLLLEQAKQDALKLGTKKSKQQLLGDNENDVIESNKPGKKQPAPQAKKQKKEADKGISNKCSLPFVRLSTGVHLLDPTAAADHANAQARAQARAQAAARAGAEGARVMEPEALQRFPSLIQRFMVSQGFVEPTPIQAACWPPGCAGQDVLGVAEPGSGKTLAYLLPGVIKLQAAGHSSATSPETPPMLILAPTRELAMQVASTCRLVQKLTGLRTACIYGGVSKEQQVEVLQKHPHIIVATPGRLLDLIDDRLLHIGSPATMHNLPGESFGGPFEKASGTKAVLHNTSGVPSAAASIGGSNIGGTVYVVIDEADKMLSLGFQPQLARLRGMLLPEAEAAGGGAEGGAKKKAKKMLQQPGFSQRPQVLMFTATMPQDMSAAASIWLQPSGHRALISGGPAASSISSTVTQVVQVCAEHKKPAKLTKHLQAIKAKSVGMRNPPRLLVFANRVKTVRFLHDMLSKEGYRVVMLHGERSQPERDDAMRSFRGGKAQIMVATDVAARGLDIRQLPYVVNYDFPSSLETYVHRVGRTGRLAAFGHAYSFFTRNLARIASPLISLLQQHSQAVDPNLTQLAEAWKTVEAHLGPEALEKHAAAVAAGSDGEEEDPDSKKSTRNAEQELLEARMDVDDLNEGLAGPCKTPKGLKSRKPVGEGGDVQDGDMAPDGSMQARLAKANANGAAAAMLKASLEGVGKKEQQQQGKAGQPPYIAASKFDGARAGYCFRKGDKGLGYYVDKSPQVSRAALLQQTARGKGPIIPTSTGSKASKDNLSRFDSSDSESISTKSESKGDDDEGSSQGGGSDSDGDSDFMSEMDMRDQNGIEETIGGTSGSVGKKRKGGNVSDDTDSDSGDDQRNGGKWKGKGAKGRGGRQAGSRGRRGGARGAMQGVRGGGVQKGGVGKSVGNGSNKKLPGRLRKKLAKGKVGK